MCVGTAPDIFPINYVVDDRTIVFRTAEGTKLAGAVLAERSPSRSTASTPHGGVAWSVVAKGPAIELTLKELSPPMPCPCSPGTSRRSHGTCRSDPTR